MRTYRQGWERFANQIWGNPATAAVPAAGVSRGLIVWLVIVALLILATGLLLLWFGASVASLIGVIWGFAVGGSLLVFVHEKLVMTFVGGLAGAALSKFDGFADLADMLQKQNEAVKRIAAIVSDMLSLTPPISTQSVWLFFFCLFFTCLFAYR
jgi:hypothetical protein